MRFLRSRRGLVAVGVLLLLALFLVRPGANRLKARIVGSINAALGRPVEVASVNLRLLPHPGFDLENFVVHEDPGFGAEPMLRAGTVAASLRLTSLLRGRLEIARLDLTEPSLNLVHNADGHWNLEHLIQRATEIPTAPTAKSKAEIRPAFPYIQATRGRINLKLGAEKKPYALTDADFALWQESENTWGMRLKAEPVRTDLKITDTGILRVNGSWLRAASLRDTPLRFSFSWEGAQLGQLTKLAYGNDKGWRGAVAASVSLSGTPANLAVTADASADDFRRFDIMSRGDLRLAAECKGSYSSMDNVVSNIVCHAPVGEGGIMVSGRVASLFASPSYELTIAADSVPIQSVLTMVRHARQGVPDDLAAAGQIDGTINVRRDSKAGTGAPVWNGAGKASDFRLISSSSRTELVLGNVPLVAPSAGETKRRGNSQRTLAANVGQPSPEPGIDLGPFHLALGRPSPLTIRGHVGPRGYEFDVSGDAQVPRLLQAERALGLPVALLVVDGSAKLDLKLVHGWWDPGPLRATGNAQLRSVRAEVRGLNEPLEIASANLTLGPDQIHVQNAAASVAGTSWRGSLVISRPCLQAGGCLVHFDLRADEIATDRLNQLLSPNAHPQPWYRFLSSSATSGNTFLLTVNATGKLTASQVLIHKLTASHLSANVELNMGKLRVSELRADVLGGKHTGEWKADFTSKPPHYSGSGTLERASLGQLAEMMHDKWVTGSASATYRASVAGLSADELFASAEGSMQMEAWSGTLPHIVLAEGVTPLEVRHLKAHLLLRDGKIEVQDGKLETPADTFQLTGSASLGRVLNLKLARGGTPTFNITGTLNEPHVSAVTASATRAALKP